jgi:hypothetical protein
MIRNFTDEPKYYDSEYERNKKPPQAPVEVGLRLRFPRLAGG